MRKLKFLLKGSILGRLFRVDWSRAIMEIKIASPPADALYFPAMNSPNRLVSLLALCLMTGCVHFHPLPVSPVQVSAEFESRSLADPGLKAFLQTNLRVPLPAWPLSGWDFTNLTLAAFYYNPDLDVARAKWAVSQAGKKTAAERPNPTLSVLPGYSATESIPSPWLVTPTLDIPIETAGKRGYRMAQAAQLSESARMDIATTAWQVRSRVRKSMLDLWSARQNQELLKEQQDILAESVTLLENQFNAGAISAFELTQARLANVSGRIALRDAEAQSADALAQLADAIGLPVAALSGAPLSFESLGKFPGAITAAEARRQALLNRADILSALAQYAASQSALQLQIATQYPDVHLDPGYEYDQGNSKWTLGFTVTLPILNQNRGPIAEAQAQCAAAAANFNAVQARALSEIDRALAAYDAARKKREDVDALLGELQKQQKTYQGMFEAGEISKSELAAQRLQFSTVALARLDALSKSQLALGQLEDSLQSPLGFTASVWQNAPRVTEIKVPTPPP